MALPKYKITIDDEYSDGEDLGWKKTAFTSKPAIIIKGVNFSAQEPLSQEMYFTDKLKYRIAAPAMIPMQIYRNQDNEEFYVEFTAAEIDRIHSKFMKNFSKNKGLFNLEHNSEETVPAYMLECWIVDNPESDKSYSSYGVKVPKGTLFVVAQVTDKEYYASLVENGQTGFSIEGFLGLSLSDMEQKQSKTECSDNNNENIIKTEMENKDLVLPEGARFQIEDKWYEVKDGKVVEVIEAQKEVAASEDVVEEEVKVEEQEMASEEVPAEEVAKEEEIAAAEVPVEAAPVVETYTKEEVDAKFDELYKMIADLQTEEVSEEAPMTEEVKMSAHDRLAGFVAFSKK